MFSCDLTAHGKSRKVYTLREPLLGAITAITPFNHPLNQVIHKVAPVVATNNRIVLKPSEKTPLTAFELADIFYEAGLPPEMLSVLSGDPAEIGDELLTMRMLTSSPLPAACRSASPLRPRQSTSVRYWNWAATIPSSCSRDADLEEAATLAASGSYKNSGQRCTAIKRMLIQESVADRFVELLVEKTRAVRYGDPFDPTMDMGTVIDEASARRFEAVVNEAVAAGARLLIGNFRRGALYSPTVLDRVTPAMAVVRYETFGPVSPVIRFKTVEEAISIANGTAYGLSSSLCTNRIDLITRFVRELQVGSVNVREGPRLPAGDDAFGRHQGFRVGLQRGGAGIVEELLQHQDLFPALVAGEGTKAWAVPSFST